MKTQVDTEALRRGIQDIRSRSLALALDSQAAKEEADARNLVVIEAEHLQSYLDEGRERYGVAMKALDDLLSDEARTEAFQSLAHQLGSSKERAMEDLGRLALLEYGRQNKAKAVAALKTHFIGEREAALAAFVERHKELLQPQA